jgi:2-haloacid dehalogenase
MDRSEVKAIVFDLFGTVVDWRGSIIDVGGAISARGGPDLDWGGFADRWRRAGYLAPIAAFGRGERPLPDIEAELRRQLDEQCEEAGIASSDRDELLGTWRRLRPWPDSVNGLRRLRARYVVAPLSNGSFAQLTAIAKWAALPWDCIISTELFSTYKPDPRAYLGAAGLLGVEPNELMLVAAHAGDLRAAHSAGLATAYIPRPLEWGPSGPAVEDVEEIFDLVAADLGDLADQLAPSDDSGH